ncbi:MAG: response regulator transcription factor [Burkholderiaceae bacterium]
MLAEEPGITIVGQAADGAQAIEIALQTKPDIVVMDLQMPHVSGVVATHEITSRLPATRVVVLTTFDDDELVFEAIRAGAHAYLLKDASEAEVLETIRAVSRGESRLSPVIARKVMEQLRRSARPAALVEQGATGERASEVPAQHRALPSVASADQYQDPLTDKEERILELISQGKSNKQIAATVFLAEGTIKNYVSRIMEKLHARSRTELAVMAVERRD